MEQRAVGILQGLLRTHGKALLSDPQRIKAFLSDEFPEQENRKRIKALYTAIEEGVAGEIKKRSAARLDSVAVRRLNQLLVENAGLQPELAIWAVCTWAEALGKQVKTETMSQPEPKVDRPAPVAQENNASHTQTSTDGPASSPPSVEQFTNPVRPKKREENRRSQSKPPVKMPTRPAPQATRPQTNSENPNPWFVSITTLVWIASGVYVFWATSNMFSSLLVIVLGWIPFCIGSLILWGLSVNYLILVDIGKGSMIRTVAMIPVPLVGSLFLLCFASQIYSENPYPALRAIFGWLPLVIGGLTLVFSVYLILPEFGFEGRLAACVLALLVLLLGGILVYNFAEGFDFLGWTLIILGGVGLIGGIGIVLLPDT